jgi:hypothetical protein
MSVGISLSIAVSVWVAAVDEKVQAAGIKVP